MIGIDIIEVRRFNGIKKSDFEFWKKYFSNEEWLYCFNFSNFHEHLAGIFAAKESIIKVLGADLIGRFDKIRVSHDESGGPFAIINGKRNSKINISISHEKKYAVAVAIYN